MSGHEGSNSGADDYHRQMLRSALPWRHGGQFASVREAVSGDDAVVTCFCCDGILVRGSDVPEAHWLRQGDFYCRNCDLLIWREELIEGWPAGRVPCRKHLNVGTKENS